MCLILLAWQAHPRYPLVVAANRDEFFARPTAGMAFWRESPRILAGRDLSGGGTWLGVTRDGRFAALTNYRDPAAVKAEAPSRGELVSRFLREDMAPADYGAELERIGEGYNGFNLLFGTLARPEPELRYYSNRSSRSGALSPGLYGLSNHLLDTPWPKVAQGKSALAQALAALPDEAPLMALLRDEAIAADEDLPRTGVSLEWERLLSAAFVRSPDYGTRSANTLVLQNDGDLRVTETGFNPAGVETGRCRVSLRLSAEAPW